MQKEIYRNDYISVKDTGRDYDFFATIENLTDRNIIITDRKGRFDAFLIAANDWCGLLCDSDGYNTFNAITSSPEAINYQYEDIEQDEEIEL